jgi:hypothetical protein
VGLPPSAAPSPRAAGGRGSAAKRRALAESQRARAAGGRGVASERRVHVRGIARARAAALEASLVRSHAHVLIKKRLARPCMEVFVAGAEDAFALHAGLELAEGPAGFVTRAVPSADHTSRVHRPHMS